MQHSLPFYSRKVSSKILSREMLKCTKNGVKSSFFAGVETRSCVLEEL